MSKQPAERDLFFLGEVVLGDLPRLEVRVEVRVEIEPALLDEAKNNGRHQQLGGGSGLEDGRRVDGHGSTGDERPVPFRPLDLTIGEGR